MWMCAPHAYPLGASLPHFSPPLFSLSLSLFLASSVHLMSACGGGRKGGGGDGVGGGAPEVQKRGEGGVKYCGCVPQL